MHGFLEGPSGSWHGRNALSVWPIPTIPTPHPPHSPPMAIRQSLRHADVCHIDRHNQSQMMSLNTQHRHNTVEFQNSSNI